MNSTVLLLVNFRNTRFSTLKPAYPDINFASVTHWKCKGHTGPGGLRHQRPHDANIENHSLFNK